MHMYDPYPSGETNTFTNIYTLYKVVLSCYHRARKSTVKELDEANHAPTNREATTKAPLQLLIDSLDQKGYVFKS